MKSKINFWGFLRFCFYYCLPPTRRGLKQIVNLMVPSEAVCSTHSFMVFMLVGPTHVGKTHALKSNSKLAHSALISSKEIHNMLNTWFRFLQDDNTPTGPGYWPRQYFTWVVRRRLIGLISKRRCCVVLDSANLTRRIREEQFDLFADATRVIVEVVCPKEIVLERVGMADDVLRKEQKPSAWRPLFDQQLDSYEVPVSGEADTFLRYYSESGKWVLVSGDPKILNIFA